MLLGVNIDHVATLRQARGTNYPSPLQAALLAETYGADLITLHLREDRRHIQDADVFAIKAAIQTRMNLEMALTDEMLENALKVAPEDVCLVPEKREEVTTEGVLDVIKYRAEVTRFTETLKAANIRVSLFIDPDISQIQAAYDVGAPVIELHTGAYAGAVSIDDKRLELERVKVAARHATELGLVVNAGHGLNIHNVGAIAKIVEIKELNIGHALIAQSIFLGLPEAIKQMKAAILKANQSARIKNMDR